MTLKKYFIINFLCFTLFVLCRMNRTTADLTVITYSPLSLNLSFSKPVALPPFQLLFNQISMPYSIQNNLSLSQFYLIDAQTDGIVNPTDFITEKYVLMFLEPFEIDQGNLALSSFLLRAHRTRQEVKYVIKSIAEKSSHFQYQNFSESLNILALVICIVIYFLAYTTVIGLTTYYLIAFYVYLSLETPYFTALDYKIAFYMFFQVSQVNGNGYVKMCYTLVPHMLLLLSFLVGIICRFSLMKLSKRSGICHYIYYFLSYKFMIVTWQLIFIPIFANTLQYFRYFSGETTRVGTLISSIYVYFSCVIMLLYIYLSYFTVNPQIGETQEKWKQYTKSNHYLYFEGFSFGVNPQGYLRRSFKFIIAIFTVLFLILITLPIGMLISIFLQILYLIYIVAWRPFKYDFFNKGNLFLQVILILLYIFRYLSQKYIKISEDVTTSWEISGILLADLVIFCIVVMLSTGMAIFQFINRLKMMIINIRQLNYKSVNKGSGVRSYKDSLFKREQLQKNQITLQGLKDKQNQINRIEQYVRPLKMKLKQPEQKKQMNKNATKKKNNKEDIEDIKMEKGQSGFRQRKMSDHSNKSKSSSMTKLQKKQKWNSKLKHKSSLLQSMSLELHNSPPGDGQN